MIPSPFAFPSSSFCRRALAGLLLFAGLAAASPAAAEPGRWTLRGRALATDYEKRLVSGSLSGRTELDLDGGSGVELAAEYRSSPRVGWELSVGQLSLDGDLRLVSTRLVSVDPFVLEDVTFFRDHGDFVLRPVAVSFLFHPLGEGERRFDLYLGPQVAWVSYDVDISSAQDREAEAAYGAKLGAELRLGSSPWSVGLELRHLETLHEAIEHDLYGTLGIDAAALMLAYHLGG
jgi:Outer membrane protein beta-barrel domain